VSESDFWFNAREMNQLEAGMHGAATLRFRSGSYSGDLGFHSFEFRQGREEEI
jgi:hypothetical protein